MSKQRFHKPLRSRNRVGQGFGVNDIQGSFKSGVRYTTRLSYWGILKKILDILGYFGKGLFMTTFPCFLSSGILIQVEAFLCLAGVCLPALAFFGTSDK